MPGVGKKGPRMCSQTFADLCDTVSKAALVDALWCASQLGTDESPQQITTQAMRNLVIALEERGDRISQQLRATSEARIDSDPD